VSNRAAVTVTIANRLGLHARPAMAFVETAAGFEADVRVTRAGSDEVVDGKSIMHMMMLAATRGTEVEIVAQGPDADAAVAALSELVKSRFGED